MLWSGLEDKSKIKPISQFDAAADLAIPKPNIPISLYLVV